MHRYLLLIAILPLAFLVAACNSGGEKRINKDIIGINEQLYDLEKNQIRDDNRLKKLENQIGEVKKEENKEKDQDKNENFDQIYKEGYKNYLEQNYTNAIELFSRLTEQFKSDSLIDNALYWQAESYWKLNQTGESLNYYHLIYRYFPFSNKADDALYKIGMIYMEMKDNSRASLAFSRLIMEYPESDLYKPASLKIKELKNISRRKRQ